MSDIDKLKENLGDSSFRAVMVFNELVKYLDQTPEGKAAIKSIAESGYTLYVEGLDNGATTRLFPESKILLLDHMSSAEDIGKSVLKDADEILYHKDRDTQLNLLSRLDARQAYEDKLNFTDVRKRFDGIVEQAYYMPGGKELLDKMSENTYKFRVTEKGSENWDADFRKTDSYMYLNLDKSDKELAAAMLRESEKAIEHMNRPNPNILSDAFVSKNAGEKERFEKLLETAYQTPLGKEIIDNVVKLGYTFSYEDLSASHAAGMCYGDLKTIQIDPKFPEESQITTIVHEMRHAVQSDLWQKNFGGMHQSALEAADFIKYNRAAEADACAYQSGFLYQLKDVWPEAVPDTENMQIPMAKAYFNEMEKTGDTRAAMNASFKSWYDYEHYQEAYERNHSETLVKWSENASGCFKTPISNADILSTNLYEGTSYVEEDFLETDIALALSQKRKEVVSEALAKYGERYGFSAEASLDKMVRREDVKSKESFKRSTINHNRPENRAMFSEIVDEMYKTPEGKQIILEGKTKNFYFEELADGQKTERLDAANMIILDPRQSAKDLAVAVSKDIRDAEQEKGAEGRGLLVPSYLFSPKEEIARLDKLTEMVSKLPGGEKAVKGLSEQGYAFEFEKIVGKKKSIARDADKTIVLDSVSDDKVLAVSLLSDAKNVLKAVERSKKNEKETTGKRLKKGFHSMMVNMEKQLKQAARSPDKEGASLTAKKNVLKRLLGQGTEGR